MRELIVWILFLIVGMIAAFQGGYIYRDREADELRKQVYQHDSRIKDLNGRLAAIEGKKK